LPIAIEPHASASLKRGQKAWVFHNDALSIGAQGPSLEWRLDRSKRTTERCQRLLSANPRSLWKQL